MILYVIDNYKILEPIDTFSHKPIHEPYFSKICGNVLKIMFVGDSNNHKGIFVLLHLLKYYKLNIKIRIYLLGYFNKVNLEDFYFCEYIEIINLNTYKNYLFYDNINDIKPNLFLLLSIYYETYSYITGDIIKTGLPIFYNELVYSHRPGRKNNNYFHSIHRTNTE